MSRRIRSFLNQNTNTLVACVAIFVGISVGVSVSRSFVFICNLLNFCSRHSMFVGGLHVEKYLGKSCATA